MSKPSPTHTGKGGAEYFYLLGPFAPWIPTFFSLGIVLGLAFIHLLAWRVGHLTITPKSPSDPSQPTPSSLTFLTPPISLTANAQPMYWFYAFGCVAFAIAAARYIHGFKRVLWKYATSLADCVPVTVATRIDVPSPPHPETPRVLERSNLENGARVNFAPTDAFLPPGNHQDEIVVKANKPERNEDFNTPPNRRLAFWRHHFRRSERLLETPAVISPALGTFRSRYQSHRAFFKKPVLKLANIFVHIALIAFALQAIVPARRDALSQLGSRCRKLKDIYVMQIPRQLSDYQRKGNSTQLYDSWSTRWLQSGMIREHLVEDPFDPKPSPTELSLSPDLIYCDTIELEIRDFWTLTHAVSAMVFFFFSFSAMGLFSAWLIARSVAKPCCARRSGAEGWILEPLITSIIVKVLLVILPLFRPAEWIKKDLLRHVSLVDWAGIAQRTSVFAILVFLCTLGIEIRQIRKGLEIMEARVANAVTDLPEVSSVMSG